MKGFSLLLGLLDDVTLALTPALSPGERENRSPSPAKIRDWIDRAVVQITEPHTACSLSRGRGTLRRTIIQYFRRLRLFLQGARG